MALDSWLAFFVACWIISISPGAGAISCMAAGLRYGFRRALPNLLGSSRISSCCRSSRRGGRDPGGVYAGFHDHQVARRRLPHLAGNPAMALPVAAVDPHAADVPGGSPRELLLRGFLVNGRTPRASCSCSRCAQFIDPTRHS